MGHRRAGFLLILLASSALADQGPPVYTATGTQPVAGGACSGPRVQVGETTGSLWCCVASQWTECGATGGSTPGGSSGNLQTNNGAGGFGAYAGGACTGAQLVQSLDASGAPTCYQLRLDQLAEPTTDITWQFAGSKVEWEFTTPVDSAFTIHLIDAYTGDGLHIHQHSGNVGAGTDLVHIEATDADATGLRVQMGASTHQAVTVTGAVDVTGDVAATTFTGPLTGNASTATALAADPADCTAGQYATTIAASGALTCAQVAYSQVSGPPSIPADISGAPFVTTAASGLLSAEAVLPTCTSTDKLTFNGTTISCAADVGGTYTLPAATATVLGGVKGTGSALVCSGTDKATGFAADGTLQCAADQTGGAGSVDLRGFVTAFGGF